MKEPLSMIDKALINEFLSYESRIHGLAETTIDNYRHVCRQWAAFAEQRGAMDLKLVGADIFLDWIDFRTSKGLRDRTIEGQISSLRSFYSWVASFHGYISPILNLPSYCAAPSPEQNHLSVKEAWAMLKAIDRGDIIGKRNRLIIAILWSTGLRSRELCALRWNDFDLENGILLVRKGKGNRQRQLFLNERLRTMVKKFRHGMLASPYSPVLCSYSCARSRSAPEKRLTLSALIEVVRETAKAARIKRKVTPMTLRHTFATHMYEAGVPLEEIKDMMGHTDKTETGVYIHITLDAIRRVLNKHASYRWLGKRAS
jgi:site-specific recombinase XerD